MNESSRRRIVFGLVPLLSSFLIGCASLRSTEPPVTEVPKNVPEEGYRPSEKYGDVSLDSNKKVDQWLSYFTGRGRKYMHIYLERSARYIPMMKATFRERGMPEDLAYIAMIESGFSATAHSHASAVGYWQFIRETGKRYNLRIDHYVDERRDPILSTQSAATYLDSLYSIFGDWHLALCGYNAGERRILNAVMKHRTRDFWKLSSIRRGLPKETANYIPKYIAAVMIAKNPAEYGFTDIDFQPAFSFESVVIERPISLELLAKELGVSFEDLKRMNPRYKSDFVPVYSDRINAVRVPVGMSQVALAALPKVASDAPKYYVAEYEYYRVRRGDTLSHIARRHRTSIARIKDLNNLSRKSVIRVGQKIKVPSYAGKVVSREVSGESKKKSQVAKQTTKKTVATGRRNTKSLNSKKVHVVRRGENLSTIAKKYRTSVSNIIQANNIGNQSKIFVGAKLVIPN